VPERHLSRIGSVMQRYGRRASRELKRPVPLLRGIAEFGVDGRRHLADGAVRLDGAVISPSVRRFRHAMILA
jgi:hypothetical protein